MRSGRFRDGRCERITFENVPSFATHLGARLIRSYARDWLDGSGKFAALCLPYLLVTGLVKVLVQ